MLKQKSLRHSRRAFTLIEIMVAAAVTIIMVGLVIQITSDVLKIWNRSLGKLSANVEARYALDLLTTDLESAIFANNGEQWLRVEAEQDVGSPTVGQTVGLKLFSAALDQPTLKVDGTDEVGNICAVAYRLEYASAFAGANTSTYVLFRALEGPSATFDLLGPAAGNPQSQLTAGFWSDSNITQPDNYLAANIVDFKVFIYGVDDSGSEIILNDPSGDGSEAGAFTYGGSSSTSDTVPTFAEIVLTIVSDEGLEILSLPSLSGTGYDDVEVVIREHSEVFKRRVYFQGKPL